jgi:cobalamin synthase
MLKALATAVVYLGIVMTTLSALEPQGLAWTLTMIGTGAVVATGVLLLFKRASQQGLTRLLGKKDWPPVDDY